MIITCSVVQKDKKQKSSRGKNIATSYINLIPLTWTCLSSNPGATISRTLIRVCWAKALEVVVPILTNKCIDIDRKLIYLLVQTIDQ